MESSLSFLHDPEVSEKFRLWNGQEIQGLEGPEGLVVQEESMVCGAEEEVGECGGEVEGEEDGGVDGGDGGRAVDEQEDDGSVPTKPSDKAKVRL